MDLEKIREYNEQQRVTAEERGKTEDLALALTYLLSSNEKISKEVKSSIKELIEFTKNHKAEVSVNNQVLPEMDGVIEAVKELKEEMSQSKKSLETVAGKDVDFSEVVGAVKELKDAVSQIPTENPTIPDKVTVENQPDYTPQFNALEQSVRSIKIEAPIVNVEKPDLEPVKQAIEKNARKPSYLDLSTYRAQDLDEMEPGIQYVGFTNLDGYWYILKNDVKNNRMRYKFGKGDYGNAWAVASTFRYKLLEEAINAIKA